MSDPLELLGTREEVVTYTVKDRAGLIRGRGLPSQESAQQIIAQLMENEFGQHPYEIERVTFVSFTRREVVETVKRKR